MALVILTAIIAVICLMIPRLPQPQPYHFFADDRTFLGISNFGDVVSNLPFAAIGLWGVIFLLRSGFNMNNRPFIDQREMWPYLFVFGGLFLTAFGSSFYHLAPDNAATRMGSAANDGHVYVDGGGSNHRANQSTART
jgi:hypothetical protein